MFRIFKNDHSYDKAAPYLLGDGVWGSVFGIIAVLLLIWLAVTAPALMYLPALSILAGLLLLLYLGGGEGELRGRAAYYTAYTLLVYGWTGMNWAMFSFAVDGGSLLVGLAGWIVLAITGVFVLVFPSFEAADGNLGGLVIIPLAVLWASALIYGLSDETNTYYRTASALVRCMFLAFGVLMAAAFIVYLVTTVREIIEKKESRIAAAGAVIMFLFGMLPVAAIPFLSTLIKGPVLAAVILAYFFLLALVSYRRGRRGPAPGIQFSLLPLLLTWIAKAVSTFLSMGTAALLPLTAAGKVLGVFGSPLGSLLADRAGTPSLSAFSDLSQLVFSRASEMIAKHIGSEVQSLGMPDLLAMTIGFFLLLAVIWLGTLIRDKTSK